MKNVSSGVFARLVERTAVEAELIQVEINIHLSGTSRGQRFVGLVVVGGGLEPNLNHTK